MDIHNLSKLNHPSSHKTATMDIDSSLLQWYLSAMQFSQEQAERFLSHIIFGKKEEKQQWWPSAFNILDL